jgi:hypothetical protein
MKFEPTADRDCDRRQITEARPSTTSRGREGSKARHRFPDRPHHNSADIRNKASAELGFRLRVAVALCDCGKFLQFATFSKLHPR